MGIPSELGHLSMPIDLFASGKKQKRGSNPDLWANSRALRRYATVARYFSVFSENRRAKIRARRNDTLKMQITC